MYSLAGNRDCKKKLYIAALTSNAILVPRGRAPFGQHQESRLLAPSNDIPV